MSARGVPVIHTTFRPRRAFELGESKMPTGLFTEMGKCEKIAVLLIFAAVLMFNFIYITRTKRKRK